MFFSGQTKMKICEKSTDNSDCRGNTIPFFQASENVQPSQTESSISTNKRKIENDQEIGSEIHSNKKARSDVQCKLDQWEAVKDEIKVDLFCVQGWRDEFCRCTKVRLNFII